MTRAKKYMTQVGVPLQPEYRKVLEQAADRTGLSLSAYARMILIEKAFSIQKEEWYILKELGYDQPKTSK